MPIERPKKPKIIINSSGKSNKTVSAANRQDSQKTENIRSTRKTIGAKTGVAASAEQAQREAENKARKQSGMTSKVVKITTDTVKPGKTRIGSLAGLRGGGGLGTIKNR